MKKSGIVLCVFAFVLFISGFILCMYAKSTAAKEGISLFDASSEMDSVRAVEITDEMNYIIVNYESAVINVYGNSDRNTMELVNFSDNDVSVKNAGVTISSSKDTFNFIYDTLKNFKGIRNIIFPKKAPKGDKKINIYLKSETPLSQLKFTVQNGDVNISNVESNTDYDINITGEGNVSLSGVKTKSKIKLNAEKVQKISLYDIQYNKFEGELNEGNVYLIEKEIGKHLYDVEAVNGCVYVSSESQVNKFFKETALEQSNFAYKVNTGNIYISTLSEEENNNGSEDEEDK